MSNNIRNLSHLNSPYSKDIMQIYIVFHKYIFDECYKGISKSNLDKYFTFVAVNKKIKKYYTPNKYKIIKEWNLPHYKNEFQELGHNQAEYNKRSVNDKMSSYYHFLSELHIMQRCSSIICTYSSNIGRFLYMTREPETKIKSLDTEQFTILHDMSIFLSIQHQSH